MKRIGFGLLAAAVATAVVAPPAIIRWNACCLAPKSACCETGGDCCKPIVVKLAKMDAGLTPDAPMTDAPAGVDAPPIVDGANAMTATDSVAEAPEAPPPRGSLDDLNLLHSLLRI